MNKPSTLVSLAATFLETPRRIRTNPRFPEGARHGVVRARHGVPLLLGLLLLAASPAAGVNPPVTFSGAASVVNVGSISIAFPFDTTVDAAGNVYIGDTSRNQIVKVNPQGVASVVAISGLITGLSEPTGVAVDSAGNLYISDFANNRLVEVSTSGSGSVVNMGSVTLAHPTGVAVDASGNIFISDSGNNRIVEIPSGGSAAVFSITGLATPLNNPANLAVDTSGNLYIADKLNDRIVVVAPGGAGSVLNITGLVTGLSNPYGVSVDGQGNVYIADASNNRIVEVAPGGGAGTVLNTGALSLSSPEGVGVSNSGAVYIADTSNGREVEIQAVAVNFLGVNITSNSTLTLNYSVNTDTTFGTSQTVVTQGAPSLDFTLSSTTCTGAITAPATCTVTAQFAPLAPGLRMGAVQLTNSTGTLLVSTLIYGIGQGPAMAFSPGAQSTLNVSVGGSGLSQPYAVAVDAAGDVFIADSGNSRVVEVPAGGGAQTTVGTGLNAPTGVAVDGAGDVLIADNDNNRVVEVPAGGGAQTTVGSGLHGPYGVAVDGAGDVFIADNFNNRVVEVPAGGGAQTTVGTGLNSPFDVAVDGAGDVFIADRLNNRVVEVPAGGGAQTTVGGGLDEPTGVTVDGAGDVFIADNHNGRVVEVPAGGGAQTTVDTELNYPYGVAVDGAGDVFIADTVNNQVVEVQRSAPPSFSFASTVVFSTSSDSPQSATVQNIGNQSLNAVAPGLSFGVTSFAQAAGPGTPPDCTTTFSLMPGASCNLSVMFTPQTTGSIVSDATFTDNALNAASATQNIGLSGTGTPATLTITASSGTMTYGGTAPTITPMYNGFVNGDGSSVVTGITCNTTASSSSPAGSSPTTSCSGASAPSYYNIVYVGGSVTVSKASLTITASSTSMTYGGAPPAVTPMYSAFAGTDTAASLTPQPTCSTTASSSTPAGTDTGANTCSGAVDANYNFAYLAGNVTVGKASLTITASSTSMTYGGTPPAVAPMYSAFAGTDTASSLTPQPTCSTTASSSTPAGTDTGANTCSGAVDANYNFAYVAGNVTVGKASLTITASSTSMTYGGTPPAVTPGYSVFAGTDTVASLTTPPTCSTTASNTTPAGTDTGANTCSGAVDSNYNFAYVAGNVTVGKASLTITASSTSMTYGATPPAVTPMYSAFAGTDTVASLTPAPTCSTTASNTTPAGTDTGANTCSGAVDANYNFAYVAGDVTINKASLTITAGNTTMTYGGTPPAVTPGYSAFAGTDTVASLTTAPTCATTASNTTPAGTDTGANTCSGAVDANYNFAYVAGNVTINKASLTITASSTSMTYGGTPPAVLPLYSAFAGTDTVASLTTAPTCATTATNSTPAGTDTGANTCSGAVDNNYNFTYAAGDVTIGKASLTITAGSTTMTYGGTPPAVTPLYSAFAGIDTVASLTTAPTCVTTATNSTPAGTDTGANTCSGAVDPNYNFTYAAGNVTINKATPTVTLVSSKNPVLSLNPITFTATVAFTVSTPTGTVSFYDGTTLLGSAVTLTAGVATYTTSSLAIAAHPITAVYSGDSNFVTVTSSVLTQTVEDFTLNIPAGGTTSGSGFPGGAVTYVFQLAPSGGTIFPSAITLTASGLPAGATATFTPATIAAGAGTTTVTLVIQLANQILASNPSVHFGVAPGFSPALTLSGTPGGTRPDMVGSPALLSVVAAVSDRRAAVGTPPLQIAALMGGTTSLPRNGANPLGRGLALMMVGGIFLLPFGGRLRRSRGRATRFVGLLLLTFALMCAALGFTACGGGGNGFFGQQVKGYTVTITGTSGALSHTTTVSLTVQ